MAFQPCPGILEVTYHYTWQGEDCYNVMHVDNGTGSPWVAADVTTVINAMGGWWGTNMQSLQSNLVTFVEIRGRDLTSSTGVEVTGAYGGAGSVATATLPNNCTIAVKWGTGLAGRTARGRTFHIGLVEAQVTGNTLNPTPLASIRTAYNALITAVTGTGKGHLVVLSRSFNKVKRTNGVGFQITAATFADAFVDSQRRRLPNK